MDVHDYLILKSVWRPAGRPADRPTNWQRRNIETLSLIDALTILHFELRYSIFGILYHIDRDAIKERNVCANNLKDFNPEAKVYMEYKSVWMEAIR